MGLVGFRVQGLCRILGLVFRNCVGFRASGHWGCVGCWA